MLDEGAVGAKRWRGRRREGGGIGYLNAYQQYQKGSRRSGDGGGGGGGRLRGQVGPVPLPPPPPLLVLLVLVLLGPSLL